MSAAAEFGAVLLALALFAGLGWPLTRCLSLRSRLDALGAAPVLGFGWFGIAATLLYRAGLPPWSAWAVMLASPYGWASLTPALRSGKAEARETRLLAVGFAGVVLLLLGPELILGLGRGLGPAHGVSAQQAARQPPPASADPVPAKRRRSAAG